MCVCVCVRIDIYMRVCMCLHAYIHENIHIRIHLYIYIHVYLCMYVYMCTYIYIYISQCFTESGLPHVFVFGDSSLYQEGEVFEVLDIYIRVSFIHGIYFHEIYHVNGNLYSRITRMWANPCICMHMYARVYKHAFCKCASMHAWTYFCLYVCLYICLYVYTSVCLSVSQSISLSVSLFVYLYKYMHACIYACMYACMFVCTYVSIVHACTCVSVHTNTPLYTQKYCTLQHTATHCNTPRNTLRHTATHFNTSRQSAAHTHILAFTRTTSTYVHLWHAHASTHSHADLHTRTHTHILAREWWQKWIISVLFHYVLNQLKCTLDQISPPTPPPILCISTCAWVYL